MFLFAFYQAIGRNGLPIWQLIIYSSITPFNMEPLLHFLFGKEVWS